LAVSAFLLVSLFRSRSVVWTTSGGLRIIAIEGFITLILCTHCRLPGLIDWGGKASGRSGTSLYDDGPWAGELQLGSWPTVNIVYTADAQQRMALRGMTD